MFFRLRRSDTGNAISIYGMFDLFEFCFFNWLFIYLLYDFTFSCFFNWLFIYLLYDFTFSDGVYFLSVCKLGLIMHSMKSLLLEIWSEQEACTSKQPFVYFCASCSNLCFIHHYDT
jgi:hypothetical protein